MNAFSIPIFPDGSAASTVTATVWVGVMLVVWCNLRFGWCLSGLVVPGYLVPLMLVRPASVAVMMFEAVVTYLIVYALSEWFRNARWWCGFFGRDRFFALIATSVFVRVICDGYAFPALGHWANERFGWNFNYHDQLHSVGLVVVALIANYFWKPGLIRGSGPLGLTILGTYIVVRYALIPYTTFDIASLRYVYEDIASSLLASPKAYMVLLTTAYLASHMNLRFSWEYNGILIPALTALLWCQPSKILASFVEAFVILLVASALLKLPAFKQVNMTGGRKVAMFFTVAFVYRLALSWAASLFTPDFKITDVYGFGYLLSTLLAARFHDRGHVLRTSVATVSVSFGGALAGSLLGFLCLSIPDPLQGAADVDIEQSSPVGTLTLIETVRKDKVRLYEQQSGIRAGAIRSREIEAFSRAAGNLLLAAERGASLEELGQFQPDFQSAGFELRILEGKYAYLREINNARGSGLYVLNLKQLDGVLVSVPHPLREPYCLEAGVCLFRDLGASVLAVSGVTPVNSDRPEVLVEDTHRQLFSAVHNRLGKRRTIQVRGYRDQGPICHVLGFGSSDDAKSSLWISGGLPAGSDLQLLRSLVGEFDLFWENAPTQNIERDLVRPGFAEVYLSLRTRSALFSQLVVQRQTEEEVGKPSIREERILPWLLAQKSRIAPAGSEAYRPAQLEELLMIDQEVLQPLLGLTTVEQDETERNRILGLINAAAVSIGYRVTPLFDPHRDRRFLILEEEEPRTRNWGTYVFAETVRSPFFWQVPRPMVEINAYEFAAQSFVHSESIALSIPGAHLRANRDGAGDVTRLSNKLTLFNLVHQALLREYNNQTAVVVQTRAMKDPVEADVVFATDSGAESNDEMTPIKRSLAAEIRADALQVAFVDGSPEYAGYEIGNTTQWDSMRHSVGIEFVTAWLSPTLRWQYRQQSENHALAAKVGALGLPSLNVDVVDYLQRELPEYADQSDSAPPIIWEKISSFLHSRDVVALQGIVGHPAVERVEQLMDLESQQAFLMIRCRGGFPLVVNLSDLRPDGPVRFGWDPTRPSSAQEFVDKRATFLIRKEGAP